MTVTPPTLVCAPMPFGYGPAAKLLTLASALRARGVRLVLVGRGIGLELAARADRLFDEILPAGAGDARIAAAVRSSAAVLSIMDREIAETAAAEGTPLYVVDSLLWMREAVPPAFREARRYWAQDFIGMREVQDDYDPAPTIVGPIVSRARGRGDVAPEGLVVNLGGCETPEGAGASAPAYAEFVVEGLLHSGLARRFPGRATVMAGARCIEALRARHGSSGPDLVSLPHEASLARLARAAVVLTSPGLTTTLETFQDGVPTYFLPPQNYSQWCTLRRLRAAGLAPHALHWEDLGGSPRLRDRMPEPERRPLVHDALARFTVDGEARAGFARALRVIGDADHAALGRAQRRFFDSLGPNGALTIAEEIAEHLLAATRS